MEAPKATRARIKVTILKGSHFLSVFCSSRGTRSWILELVYWLSDYQSFINVNKIQHKFGIFSFIFIISLLNFKSASINKFEFEQTSLISYIKIVIMQRITFPRGSLGVEMRVDGVFGTPDEWKTADDANPGLFAYSIRFLTFQIEKGKIYPRELTARQQREAEEKNKKGGKKDPKKAQQINAEQQRIKKQEEEDERKREEEWSKLSEEDRNYRPFEDCFRAPQLRFENNTKKTQLQGKEYAIFEERVSSDQGEWIYFYKAPTSSEEELAKIRKAKPKTLPNLNDLNPLYMRAWVNLAPLNSKDRKQLTQRCKVMQVDRTADTPEPNLENTYIKVTLTVEAAVVQTEDGVDGSALIADPPAGEVISERVRVVSELRDELRLAVNSLSMEYSSMFWKELNLYEDFKNMNYFVNKKNEITKRKEQFLYDFNVSGKYKILKDRIKKVIVHLCQHYFTDQMANSKSFTGVSCTIKDQFYSDIYNFLVSKYRQALQELIFEKKESLSQLEVLSPQAQKKNVDKMLATYSQETLEERINRIIEEYEWLGNCQYGENILKKSMDTQPSNVGLKHSYAMYCLRNRLRRAEEVLPLVEQYLSFHKDDQQARQQYLLLLIATQNEENCKKAWVLLRDALALDPQNTTNLTLASFLFQDCLKQDEIGVCLFARAERAALRASNKLAPLGMHKDKPSASELPTLKALPAFSNSLSNQEKDQLWVEVLNLFQNLNLLVVIDKITSKIKDTSNTIFSILSLKGLLSEGRSQQFQAKACEEYEKTKSVEILELLATHFVNTDSGEAEKYLKLLLGKAKGDTQIRTILRMANYYLEKKQPANARACILKYLQRKPTNSGHSWRILGICELELGSLDTSLECLRKANIADIENSQNWIWLAKVYALKGQFSMCNQCLNQYEIMIGRQGVRHPAYEEIYTVLANSRSQNLVEEKLRVQLTARMG